MKINNVNDAAFAAYGKVLKTFDLAAVQAAMDVLPCPDGAVTYVPGEPTLECLPIYETLRDQVFGGMPIEVGYCNGDNTKLNCVEYHRDSEVNIACTDLILLLGHENDIDFTNYTYETSKIEAFLCPKGTMIEVYANTLHYAPCNAGGKFRCVVVLPKGTNTPLTFKPGSDADSKLLTHTNKWLIAHADAAEASQGAVVGLIGENIDIAK